MHSVLQNWKKLRKNLALSMSSLMMVGQYTKLVVMIKAKFIFIAILRLFYGERNYNQAFSDCVIFCFVILRLIFLWSLIFQSVSRGSATSMMELFSTLVNNFQLITNIVRTSVLNVAWDLDPHLVTFLGLYFSKS